MPLNPDEATQRDEIRRTIDLFSAAAVAFGLAGAAIGLAVGSPRALITAFVLMVLSAWLVLIVRRGLTRRPVATTVGLVAVTMIAAIVAVAVLEPLIALVAATAMLIPVAAALPYLEIRSLRRLMLLAWAATVGTGAAVFLPDDLAIPPLAAGLLRMWALILASGLVLFMLYQSSQRLKASSREFRRLFQLSADLAETTEPAVLGELIARHLAEATGFDDCVIYALAPETGQLAPFGSHPVERSLASDPESLAERPMLGRVIHDRERILFDSADERGDPDERARLRATGRGTMLLLPLVARSEPVGVAELTAAGHHSIDERRLALGQTLAFEAAMAIENGRLYHALHHRALHDSLTGLANRSLFHDRVEHALTRLARRGEASVAVLFIDLDDFKAVNDAHGHARGDRLLAIVGERLRTVVRPGDTVARLGGDEFALLLEELSSAEEALAIAERAIDAIATPFDLAGRPARASVSIGVATRSAEGATVDELIQEADAAMYEAKRSGKGRAVLSAGGLPALLGAGHPGEPG